MHKLVITLLGLFILPLSISAQSKYSIVHGRPSFYVSGNASFYAMATLNFEAPLGSKILRISNRQMTVNSYARIIAGVAKEVINEDGGPGLGAALSLTSGKGNNHVELSTGIMPSIDLYTLNNHNRYYVVPVPIIDLGYRYQKPTGGFLYRGYITFFGVGMSFGYTF